MSYFLRRTNTGRVVYNRRHHAFTPRDIERICRGFARANPPSEIAAEILDDDLGQSAVRELIIPAFNSADVLITWLLDLRVRIEVESVKELITGRIRGILEFLGLEEDDETTDTDASEFLGR